MPVNSSSATTAPATRVVVVGGWVMLVVASLASFGLLGATAVAGTVAGPVGTAVGAAVGAVVGGLAGKGIAERIDPTVEDAYWRENYAREPYHVSGRTYDQYRPAYELGWSSVGRYEGDFDGCVKNGRGV